jgi:hypothetical protein
MVPTGCKRFGHWSFSNQFSKHQTKAEFKILHDFKVLDGDFPGLRTFAASLTS